MTQHLGLKVGLEIHQQLATSKLFCRCPPGLDDVVVGEFERSLRAVPGEMGLLDDAAALEGGRRYRYQLTRNCCAVEADEAPPHEACQDALDVALTVALMLGAKPVDEVHFMRKLVVDGSNTTGFQRTGLVATDGTLEVGGRTISIPTVCLEEDAARRIPDEGGAIVYRLDRLGTALVEIATGPEIDSPELARAAALAIGQLVRDTGAAMRGIGSVREDLNVSVEGGARVEIKGVQELNSIAEFVRREAARQTRLIELAAELRRRGAAVPDEKPRDVTDALSNSASKVVRGELAKGGRAMGIRLDGFRGLLRGHDADADRLGAELAQHARAVGLKGLFHRDELPGYGISAEETEALAAALGCGADDAFVVVVAEPKRACLALERVRSRARTAIDGVPKETRDPAPDCTTTYSRPLPGEARMYPETDVPTVPITPQRLARLKASLPETRQARIERLRARYPLLSSQAAAQLVDEGKVQRFEDAVNSAGGPSFASVAASTVIYDENADRVDAEFERATFAALGRGEFAKEAISAIYAERAAKPGDTLDTIVARLGLRAAGADEVRAVVAGIVAENAALVMERGADATGPLMGQAMKRLRGKADGRAVSDALKNEIEKLLASSR